MKTSCRKTYNSKYYAQNRDRILKGRQQRKSKVPDASQTFQELNQLSLFETPNFQVNRSSWFKQFKFEYLINGLLFLLVIANSYYLLGEAIEFYKLNNTNTETSVLAAVTVELLLLGLSIIQTTNKVLKIAAKIALVLLFAYSAWSFCSSVIGKGFGALETLSAIEKKIARVETQIKERSTLVEENLRLRRVTMARKLTLEKDQLSAELSSLENQRTAQMEVPPGAQKINTLSMVALRLLLQLSSIIIVHHLGTLLKNPQKRPSSKATKFTPVIRLVKDGS